MLYYRIMVLNFQFVQIFQEQNLFYKSVRNMTQKVVHKMGVTISLSSQRQRHCDRLHHPPNGGGTGGLLQGSRHGVYQVLQGLQQYGARCAFHPPSSLRNQRPGAHARHAGHG